MQEGLPSVGVERGIERRAAIALDPHVPEADVGSAWRVVRNQSDGSEAVGGDLQRMGRIDRMEQGGRGRCFPDAFDQDAQAAVAIDDCAGRTHLCGSRGSDEDPAARIVPDRIAVALDPQACFTFDHRTVRALVRHFDATLEFDQGRTVLAIDMEARAPGVELVAFRDAHVRQQEGAAAAKVDSTPAERALAGSTLHPEAAESRVHMAAQPHGRAIGVAAVEARLAECSRRERRAVGIATDDLEHEVFAQALQQQVLVMDAVVDVVGDEDQVVAAEPVRALDRAADRRDRAVRPAPDHDRARKHRVRMRGQGQCPCERGETGPAHGSCACRDRPPNIVEAHVGAAPLEARKSRG